MFLFSIYYKNFIGQKMCKHLQHSNRNIWGLLGMQAPGFR